MTSTTKRQALLITYSPRDPTAFEGEYQRHLQRVGPDVLKVMELVFTGVDDEGRRLTLLAPKQGTVQQAMEMDEMKKAVQDVLGIIAQENMATTTLTLDGP